ncbi:MAG TPA: hypothetical protein DCY53_02095 [Desulfobacteraceae bacterium]|nr:hypothetical protein [Desulfobacteraceae bacterium]
MGRCRNHPNKETGNVCTKYTIYMCEECLKSSDPDIYCKFRSACTIWSLEKKNTGIEEANRNESTII